MATQDRLLSIDVHPAGAPATWFSNLLKSIGAPLGAWAGVCATYWEAAARYENMSALSEAELARRGLSRAALARTLCALPPIEPPRPEPAQE